MKVVYIKPIKGVLLRDPNTKTKVPTDGMSVGLSSFWRRRIADGSCVVINKPQPKKVDKEDNKNGIEIDNTQKEVPKILNFDKSNRTKDNKRR